MVVSALVTVLTVAINALIAHKCLKNIKTCILKNNTMNKYVLGVLGMRCGMCELHVEEAISKKIEAKKVKASRYKRQVVVFTELNLGEEDFKGLLAETGYTLVNFERVPAVKKWYGWR